MENIKDNMAKKKKVKKFFCYIALVILIVLLFAPMTFKIIFKNREPAKKPDVASRLVCTKGDDKITASFLNDEPQRISYEMTGDYMASENQDNEDEKEADEFRLVLRKFLSYSNMTFDTEKNISRLEFNVSATTGTVDYDLIFISVEKQEEYYRSQGFSCNRSIFS